MCERARLRAIAAATPGRSASGQSRRGLVRSFSRRTLAYFRCAQQRSANWPGADRAWTRRHRRAAQHHIRTKYPKELQGLDR